MKTLLFGSLMLLLLVLSGCSNTITGHITLDSQGINSAIEDCTMACSKCNPKALYDGCEETCEQLYMNGGIAKLNKYTELYANKCKGIE